VQSYNRRRDIFVLTVATAVYKGNCQSYLIYSDTKDKGQNSPAPCEASLW